MASAPSCLLYHKWQTSKLGSLPASALTQPSKSHPWAYPWFHTHSHPKPREEGDATPGLHLGAAWCSKSEPATWPTFGSQASFQLPYQDRGPRDWDWWRAQPPRSTQTFWQVVLRSRILDFPFTGFQTQSQLLWHPVTVMKKSLIGHSSANGVATLWTSQQCPRV